MSEIWWPHGALCRLTCLYFDHGCRITTAISAPYSVKELGMDMWIRPHRNAVEVMVWISNYNRQKLWDSITFQRHNGRDGVSNHQPHDCLLNHLFRRRSKKTSKLRVTGLCAGNSPGTVNSPHKWPVTRKMIPFDDVIMRICINPSPFTQIKNHYL